MPYQTLARQALTKTLTIPAGGSVTGEYLTIEDRERTGGLAVLVPSGFQGYLTVLASNAHNCDYHLYYDASGELVQINPSAMTLPAWCAINFDVFPALYLKFASTNSAGTAGTAQTSARALEVMGLS